MKRLHPIDIDCRDIQGIIASGYNHLDFASFIFLDVISAPQAREWLKEVVFKITNAVHPGKDKSSQCFNLALTRLAISNLGIPDNLIGGFPYEFAAGMHRPEAGMVLGDVEERGSHERQWEYGGSARPLQIMAMLYADSPAALHALFQRSLGSLKGLIVVNRQDSIREQGDETEPFGFRDGISQPEVKGLSKPHIQGEAIAAGEFLLGYENELGQFTRVPAIDNWRDPMGYLAPHPQHPATMRAFGLNGTYLVFRKLQQEVDEFWKFVDDNCEIIDDDNLSHQRKNELFAAKMVGRWRSGAALVLAKNAPGSAPHNDFLYTTLDPAGIVCPVGAHIRRANPRDSLPMSTQKSLQSSRRHRIIRRGRKYCEPAQPPTPKNPRYDRGIYFIALNADLRRQYEFIQQSWLNDPTFNGLDNDKDPLAGGNSGDGQFTIQACPLPRHVRGIQNFVTVKGGGYFFLPSIRALKFLAHWQP